MSAFRNALRRSLLPSKRYTAIFCYNSPSWRQPQQLRQRLIPLRRIQSSGTSTRDANTTSGANNAGFVKAPASASMTSTVSLAGIVKAPCSASMERDAPDVRSVAAPAFANMTSGANGARHVRAQAFASTTSITTDAPSAKTSRAPWKAAPCSVTVSAQPESYSHTCAPSTAASPKH